MNYYTLTVKDNDYRLVLTTRYAAELEKKLGCNPINLLIEATENRLPKIGDMALVLWASAQRYQHNFKLEEAYDLFDEYLEEHELTDFLNVIVNIFEVSGFINTKPQGDEKN